MSGERKGSVDELIAACRLVRENGYAVVPAVQYDLWERWLRESHEREREAHDEIAHLASEAWWLLERCRTLLNGSRPQWFRDTVRRMNSHRRTEPFSGGPIRPTGEQKP